MTATCISLSVMTDRECGAPARLRRGMCEHEHLREGPLCDRCVAHGVACTPCLHHPVSPHACPVRIEEPAPRYCGCHLVTGRPPANPAYCYACGRPARPEPATTSPGGPA